MLGLTAQLGIADGRGLSIDGYGGERQGANRWHGPGPHFTAEDLAALRLGDVLWESSRFNTTDTEQFGTAACDYIDNEVYGG